MRVLPQARLSRSPLRLRNYRVLTIWIWPEKYISSYYVNDSTSSERIQRSYSIFINNLSMTGRHSDYHGELLAMKLLPVRCHGPINSLFKGPCPLQYNQPIGCWYRYRSFRKNVRRDFYRAMLCIRGTSHGPVSVRVRVRLSQVGVPSKRMNESGWFLAWELHSTYPTLCFKEIHVSSK